MNIAKGVPRDSSIRGTNLGPFHLSVQVCHALVVTSVERRIGLSENLAGWPQLLKILGRLYIVVEIDALLQSHRIPEHIMSVYEGGSFVIVLLLIDLVILIECFIYLLLLLKQSDVVFHATVLHVLRKVAFVD
jgi:hypothetical protein